MAEVSRDTENEIDYERELRKHKLRRAWAIVIAAVVVLVAIIIIVFSQRKTSYSGYKVEGSTRRSDAGAAEYIYAKGNLFRCSRDGVAAFDSEGKPLWNSTFEVGNMKITQGGEYFAVADMNGNDVYLFHTTKGELGSINSSLPILDLCVADAGYVALLVDDRGADYIHMYKMEDDHQKMYTIKKSINIDGLPVCMDISLDGQKLVSAYTGVTNGALDTNLVFSNFDEVGQNENERVVGGYDYKDELIGKVAFLNNTTVAVLAEHSLDFFRMKEYPEKLAEVELDYEVDKVFTGNTYVGLIHTDSESGKEILEVFDTAGKRTLRWEVAYDDLGRFLFSEDAVVAYGENHCIIMNMKGNIIFDYEFDGGIVDLFPIGGKQEYIYINSDYVQKIRLE